MVRWTKKGSLDSLNYSKKKTGLQFTTPWSPLGSSSTVAEPDYEDIRGAGGVQADGLALVLHWCSGGDGERR